MQFLKLGTALALGVAFNVQAGLILNGDFEDQALSGKQWGIFNSTPGWESTLGSGIEIQRNTVVQAQSGNQYIELDARSNSALTQSLELTAGQSYLLSFFYMPRTNGGDNDNGLEVYWDDFSGELADFDPINGVFAIDDQTRRNHGGWTEYSLMLTATSGNMALSFAGTGNSNSLGAFLDNVSLTAVPEPATLALFGLGLAGIGARRLHRK